MKLGYGCVRSQVMKYRPCLDMQAYTTKCHGSVIKEDLKHVLVLNFDKPNESLIALENLCANRKEWQSVIRHVMSVKRNHTGPDETRIW